MHKDLIYLNALSVPGNLVWKGLENKNNDRGSQIHRVILNQIVVMNNYSQSIFGSLADSVDNRTKIWGGITSKGSERV